MKIHALTPVCAFGIIATIALLAQPVRGQTTDTFTGTTSNDYGTASNWSSGSVPDLTQPNVTALINNGDPVTYNPGGDLRIDNGSTLEISDGSWTQINGNNYIQLSGNGNILVNGGTFNQGTDSASPFNITNSGNNFTVDSGTVNVSGPFHADPGLTYTQNGGVVNTASEFDFNASNTYMNGGVLNTTLITGVNNNANGGISEMYLSGGLINLSSGTGIYGGSYGGAQYATVDFELNSTGELSFNGGTSEGTIENMVNSGAVIYDGNLVNFSSGDFVINNVGGDNVLELAADLQAQPAVPEPLTYALLAGGLLVLTLHLRRRQARTSV